MLRKWVLSGLLAISPLVMMPEVVVSTAKADDDRWDRRRGDRDHSYQVFYRSRGGDRWNFFRRGSDWQFYGQYRSEREAKRAERRLERAGYDASVREVHHHR